MRGPAVVEHIEKKRVVSAMEETERRLVCICQSAIEAVQSGAFAERRVGVHLQRMPLRRCARMYLLDPELLGEEHPGEGLL